MAKLNVFLLKKSVSTPAAALKDTSKLTKVDATAGGDAIGELYLYQIPNHLPKWTELFPEQATTLKSLKTSGAGGLLFVKRKRLFAVAFGYSSHLLKPSVIQEGFGLRVTLNSVPGDGLRSVDAYTPDTIGKRTKTQGSRKGTIPDFGVNVDQDLLRAATGVPTDRTLGSRMTGRDSLSIVAKAGLRDVPALLDRYLEKSQEKTYQKDFGWIDKVREVTDVTVQGSLNAGLVDQFRSGAFEKTWMAVPDIVEWERIDGFRYGASKTGPLEEDLHVQALRGAFRDVASISLQLLKQKIVNAFDDPAGPPSYHWSAYGCLYAELDDGSDTYLLTNGKWFRISGDFVKEVADAVKAIPLGGALPEYTDGSEGEYNKRVAGASKQNLALMDAKNIQHGGGYSKIEFCDLFSKSGEMIHVKRYGGSAVLSHLFQQGVVSANLWSVDPDFRKKVNKLLPRTHKLKDPLKPLQRGNYRVVYAITSNRNKPLEESLPFFSKLSLKNAALQLRGLGYPVELVRVVDKTAP